MKDIVKTLEFKDLHYEVKNNNKSIKTDYARIIDSLSGKVESGKLTAVLGSSGCGKTHLLKMITGNIERNSKTSGKIFFNNEELDANLRKKISYLPQDDVFYADMSVYDHLMFYASLGSSTNIEDRIERTLTSCLILHKKHALMGNLSGGERKRALIAISMINDPEILILDEPTTGLDSNTALEIIYTLKQYASSTNSIVICTVHQPGSGLFNLFDYLLVLKETLFYSGPVKDFMPFLKNNGIYKDDTLSIPEFLFVILTSTSHHPDAIKYKTAVNNIIENNKKISETLPEICNNTKNVTWKCNFKDVVALTKFFFKLNLGKKGSLMNFFVWANIVCSIIIGPLFRIIISFILRLDSSGVSDDLKMCSYWETFIISFCIFKYLYLINFWTLIILSGQNTFQEDANFKSEYSNGRYNFGAYLFYTFFSNLLRNCIFFYLSLPIYTIIYWKVLVMNPLILFFIIPFIFISAFLFTLSLLLCQMNYLFKLPMIIGSNSFITLPIDNNDELVIGEGTKYIYLMYPIYNFIVYMRTKCYGLIGDIELRSLSNLSRFLNQIDIDNILDVSTDNIPEVEIVYDHFEINTSNLIMISAIIVSCMFSLGCLILSLVWFKVPNMRFKLQKSN